jgi:hypothetical protein
MQEGAIMSSKVLDVLKDPDRGTDWTTMLSSHALWILSHVTLAVIMSMSRTGMIKRGASFSTDVRRFGDYEILMLSLHVSDH